MQWTDSLFLLFTRPLEEMDAIYMVSGSIAAMVYGRPRLTHDVDLVLTLDEKTISRLPKVFSDGFYCPPPSVLQVESHRSVRGHFNLIHFETGYKADIYPTGNDPFHHWALERTREMTIGDDTVRIAPIEYVIVRKLEYYREGQSEKHIDDIGAAIRVSGEKIDYDTLTHWLKEKQLEPTWNEVLAKAGNPPL